MRLTTIYEEEKLMEFARRAARFFEKSKHHYSYSDKPLGPDSLLALRWGLGRDCVLVLKLAPDYVPVNYQNAVSKVDEEEDIEGNNIREMYLLRKIAQEARDEIGRAHV